MVYEFELSTDYSSPNVNTKNNKLVFKDFRKGDLFIGETMNLKKGSGVSGDVYVDRDNWMIPLSKLTRRNKEKFTDFKDYDAEKNTLKTDDLPPEIKKKIDEIANKNFAMSISKEITKNFRNAMFFAVGGVGIAMVAKKNVYLWGIGGLLAGILFNAMRKPDAEKAADSSDKKDKEEAKNETK